MCFVCVGGTCPKFVPVMCVLVFMSVPSLFEPVLRKRLYSHVPLALAICAGLYIRAYICAFVIVCVVFTCICSYVCAFVCVIFLVRSPFTGKHTQQQQQQHQHVRSV